MRLGKFRRSYTFLHELARSFSPYIDYLLWLLLDPDKFKIVKRKEIKRILFVLVNEEQGNVGGDFCLLGALNRLVVERPEIHLTLLLDQQTKKNFGEVPGIEMLEYKKSLREVKNGKFDCAVIYNLGPLRFKDFKFIRYVFAPFFPSIGSIFILKNKFNITRKILINWGTHMMNINFKVPEKIGFPIKDKTPIFWYSDQDRKNVDEFLSIKKLKKFVIIHPGGKHVAEGFSSGKCVPHLWDLNRYGEVANYLQKQGYKVLITGTKNEEILSYEIKKTSPQIISVCGKFNIRETAVLLERSKLLIATDTSVVHIAYQIGTPIIELMGPSCPNVVGAWPTNSKKNCILVDKGPCYRSMRKIDCPEGIPCLDQIKVKDVIQATKKFL
jgi:ADP-heptose:LPS heptosyltransferase